MYKVKWGKWASGDGVWVEQEILKRLGVSKTRLSPPRSRDLVVGESQGKEVTY